MTESQPLISCIIPVYNEGPRIAEVLAQVSQFSGFSEVIVIDDGSSDNTSEVAAQFPVTVIKHHQNRGKTAATHTGVTNSKGDYICMIDGDLTQVLEDHLRMLIAPIKTSECVTIAWLENAWPIFHLTRLDPWSGERVVPRWILQEIFKDPTVLDQKYIIESKINEIAIMKNVPIHSTKWTNVRNIPKLAKHRGLWVGLIKELEMYVQVYRDFGIIRTLKQQLTMPFIVKRFPDS